MGFLKEQPNKISYEKNCDGRLVYNSSSDLSSPELLDTEDEEEVDEGVGGVVMAVEEETSYLANESSMSVREMFRCLFIARIFSFSFDSYIGR